MNRGIAYRFASVVAVFCFLDGCNTWPEQRIVHTEGTTHGFEIGADKRETFVAAMSQKHAGHVRSLALTDASPTTYDEKYKGTPIVEADYERIARSDSWHLGLSTCNCWLILEFDEGRLARIEEHEWTGPTK